jgi:hypothetical protein
MFYIPNYVSIKCVILFYLHYIFIVPIVLNLLVIKNCYSKIFKVTSGIPKISHFAPILFLLYLNNITVSHPKMLFFVNDLKIYSIIKSHPDSNFLQHYINLLSNRCKLNNLSLNASKCKYRVSQ